ncbi:MAG: DNA replication/repair protein RecF [Ignavibacteria bacterium]
MSELHLKNFRNYEEETVKFGERVNYIYGNNGHGKTNLLEAISFLSQGKSFVGSNETDALKIGESEFWINGVFLNETKASVSVSLNYNSLSKGKAFFINKEKVSNFFSNFLGKFPIVFFNPHSFNITYGSPGERRKFFDMLISQVSKIYLEQLRNLAKLLKLKSTLLRDRFNYRTSEFEMLLSSYNETLISYSVEIILKRIEVLREFKTPFELNFHALTGGNQKADIHYYSNIFRTSDLDILESTTNLQSVRQLIAKQLSETLYAKKDEEIKRALSLVGPHRDDYTFRIIKDELPNGYDLKNYASQGEHRTFIIALKLTENDYLKQKLENNVILLFDDILSELDITRIEQLIKHLDSFDQVFLTTTDKHYLELLYEYCKREEIKTFFVEEGKVYEEN